MNPNPQPNTLGSERFMTTTPSAAVNQTGMNLYNNPRQVITFGMEAPRSNGRNNGIYQPNYLPQNPPQIQNNMQQYHQQQSLMQQNHQRQRNLQQQNLRFPSNEDSTKTQNNSIYIQQLNQMTQKGPRIPLEGSIIQMLPQTRFPNSQQPMRPQLNSNGAFPPHQLNRNEQNYPIMDAPKAQGGRFQGNIQNNQQVHRDNISNLVKKSSDLEINPPDKNKLSEALEKPQVIGPSNVNVQKKSEMDKVPVCVEDEEEIKSEANDLNSGNEEMDLEDMKKSDMAQKENKNDNLLNETIAGGVVQKNIKFFEANDTAKTPLRPEIFLAKKKEKKTTDIATNVVKSVTDKNYYESGVDETPVVHPNLGSIYQVPRKVAKIPNLKTNKRFRKFKSKRSTEEPFHKKPNFRTPTLSEFLKPEHSYLPCKTITKNTQNIRCYGSKEELLAFFENTKSWRKLNRYAPKLDQNSSKEKVAHKHTTNGDIPTPKKTPSKLQTPSKRNLPVSPTKTPLKSPGTPGTPGTPGPKSLPKTPESSAPPTPLIKKVPMNKIQVGAAPSPNLKTVRSKVGSLANTTHKPGGGNVKIESHKIDLSKVQPKTEAKNDMYKPSGGEKKIQQVKLQWNAQSKVGSLENATYKPGGGDKKIESVKLDFKEKAKSKVGSKDNVKHVPGGGNVKIDNQKLDFKAQSKVGSLDNVRHKPGGGDIKIFDDKTYLRQVSGNSSEGRASGTQGYSDLSVVREVEGRSAPGTPGRTVKIRKITTIENLGESPKINKITKVTVLSQTPKKEKNIDKLPTKQVKVTYTKMPLSKTEENDIPPGICRLSANNHALILKPSLSKKDLHDDFTVGKHNSEKKNFNDFHSTTSCKNARMTENEKQNSASPNLPEGKLNGDDSAMSKFLQHETVKQEKIELWREKNSAEMKPNSCNVRQHEESKEPRQTFSSETYQTGTNLRQCTPKKSEILTNAQRQSDEPDRINYNSNQNLHSHQISQNPAFFQSQQRQINQQMSLFPS